MRAIIEEIKVSTESFLRGLLQNRDHAVDDIIDRCSYWKLDFLCGVLLPVPLGMFAIIKYLVNSIVFADAPR